MNLNLLSFKATLETICRIRKLDISDAQLKSVAQKIKTLAAQKESINASDVQNIILEVVPTISVMALEGIDNSDLKTILLLATKVVGSSNV